MNVWEVESGSAAVPALAGLCSMERAVDGNWSLEESVSRLKRLHYSLKRLHEMLTEKITYEPIYELKTAYSLHAYLCAEQVDLIRRRVSEMREPPLGLDKCPDESLAVFFDEINGTPDTLEFLVGVYQVALPAVLKACQRLKKDAHPLADAPTVRVAKLIEFELSEVTSFGQAASEYLTCEQETVDVDPWRKHLSAFLSLSGAMDGVEEIPNIPSPQRRYPKEKAVYHREPRRDERFLDPFNAGVNPEAFLYEESYSAQDKTLMMYYKRIRELDVPEMMASILVDLRDEESWGFHMEMSRQLWDEARHAMMGEVGFASLGIDWTQIPINFTWSRNLNLQLDARERHGVLFYIEQGLMPRTGKRYEWEVANESGDELSALFQDFDWADEVLHAQIGRRWYVPRYDDLKEALSYGDRCWSKVLSYWREDLEKGRTEHRNWWPELYEQACKVWGKVPDEATRAFCVTYESQRADLEKI